MASAVHLSLPRELPPRPRLVSTWLLAVFALVLLIILVGGITRLTESGLSITRWEPVSGILPPLGEAEWAAELDRYRQSPEGQTVNRSISLAEYKTIYGWEYAHRLLGRLIGLAFIVPLAWFLWKRAIPPGFKTRLWVLLGLGALQGLVGWWMVASGLVYRPEVSHVRLAVHLLLAFAILGLLLWTALDLRRLPPARARMPTLAIWTLAAFAVQALFGAYVAGLEAGFAFPTWPSMGGELYPAAAPMLEPWPRNFVDNPILVQFIHRWLAFGVAALAFLLAWAAWRRGARPEAVALALAVVAQIFLGILTLASGVAIEIAAAHQLMAALLLSSILLAAHRLGRDAR